jgi:hypothetical protein
VRPAAFQNFDPPSLHLAVDLETVERVRMQCCVQSQRHARQHRTGNGLDHRDQIVARQRSLRDPPQVELMRLADVQPVDRVAPIGQAGAREQHILVARRRDHAQRARNHCRRLRAQEQLRRQIARVTGVA